MHIIRNPSTQQLRSRRRGVIAVLFALLMPICAYAQIDINRADARTLAKSMVGVGLVKAEAIVAWRTAHGPFHNVDKLAQVDGVGARTIAVNRSAIVIVVPAVTPAVQAGSSGRPFANR